MNATRLDREMFTEVKRTLSDVRADIETRGNTASEWQAAEHILKRGVVSMYRLERLEDLGWIEIQPSGGFGPDG